MTRQSLIFNTRAEAEAWAVQFLNRYPREGYSSRVSIEPSGEAFLLTAVRANSCD